jgi:conjugal transfer pilus assembly protein TraD
MNKSKSYESGLGDFMLPFVELFSLIFVKIAELLSKFVTWGFSTYVLKNKKGELSKIERSSLRIRKSTTDEGAVGYSVNQKRDIYFDDLNKGKHSAIVGASGFGKTVLIDTLMHDDLKSGKPVIFLDPKGDSGSLNQFIDLCKLTGRDFAIFSEH